MENVTFIRSKIQESIETKNRLLTDDGILTTIDQVVAECIRCFQADGKILFCGNGGSAADAQHLSAEFAGRFYQDREPLFSEALHVNTSYITAVGNDYSFEEIYARAIRGNGRRGDILFGISTSGNSPNIIKAFEVCREKGVTTVGMTGASGGKLKPLSDFLINIPSDDTPRIQECHILTGHIICEMTERALFQENRYYKNGNTEHPGP